MKRRARRRLQHAFVDTSGASGICALCGRALGRRVEWHHVIPKSRGGRETVALHPVCHRTIHAHLTNGELAGTHIGLNAVRENAGIARFLR